MCSTVGPRLRPSASGCLQQGRHGCSSSESEPLPSIVTTHAWRHRRCRDPPGLHAAEVERLQDRTGQGKLGSRTQPQPRESNSPSHPSQSSELASRKAEAWTYGVIAREVKSWLGAHRSSVCTLQGMQRQDCACWRDSGQGSRKQLAPAVSLRRGLCLASRRSM